jgi:hypothetical protein
METDHLIRTLAHEAEPVERLPHPAWRAAIWSLLSVAYIALVVAAVGVRPDIAEKLHDPRFVIEVGAALLTGVMAAAAAFCAGCPGRPVWERFAPFPFLLVWLASLGEGCWRQWVQYGPDGRLQIDLLCFQVIFALSLLPAILIFVMIRRGAPIAPMSTTGLATLAATALAATGLRLFHAEDVSLMLLVWQFGSVVVLAVLGFVLGRGLLHWKLPDPRSGDG